MSDEKARAADNTAAFIQPIATGILIGTAFLLVFLFALHKPTPHAVPVGVVGGPGVIRTLDTGSALALRPLSSTAQARQEIKNNDVYAAYVVQGGHDQLLVSDAHGAIAYHTLTGIFTDIAAARGSQLQVTLVAPAVPADPNGISVFYLIFGITLGAFLFGQTSFAFGRHLPVRQKLVQTLVFSVLLGLIGTAVARLWIHVLPGSPVAEAGILIFLCAAVGAFTLAITTLLKDAGVAIATIVGLILGTAISGGPVPASFLPSGFAFFSSAVAPGAATTALRDVAYFNPGAVTGPLLVLAAWLVVSVAVVLAASARRGTAQPALTVRDSKVTTAP
jgi:hypothetical protein